MRLLKLELFNLFGIFNHTIDYNQKERVTLLTAPNGYGKTISLKAIYSLLNKKFTFFIQLSFDKIIFTFDKDKSIEIIKINTDNIKLIFKEKTKEISKFEYPSKNLNSKIKRGIPNAVILENYLPDYIQRISINDWLNELTNEIFTVEEIIYQYSNNIPIDILKQYNVEIPKDFLKIINSFKVYFIQEQRLVLSQPISDHNLRREVVITDTIEKYSNELSLLIKQKIGEYAQITQSLDNSFPKRLFQEKVNDKDTTTNLKDRLTALQQKRHKISEYGLLKLDEDTFFKDEDIKDSDAKVLSFYISDSEKKLAVFDDLVAKIEIFTKILNERRFNFKSIEIDKDRGFIFKTKQDTFLNLTDLSSGEQHEVVILFELLFKVQENSMVLIDEPEISLHVVWQKAFLNDIQEIIDLQKIDIVIATHSPQIINDRWDLTVNLEASAIE